MHQQARCTTFAEIAEHCSTCHGEWVTGQGWPHEVYRSDVENRYVTPNELLALSCCVGVKPVIAALRTARNAPPMTGAPVVGVASMEGAPDEQLAQ